MKPGVYINANGNIMHVKEYRCERCQEKFTRKYPNSPKLCLLCRRLSYYNQKQRNGKK